MGKKNFDSLSFLKKAPPPFIFYQASLFKYSYGNHLIHSLYVPYEFWPWKIKLKSDILGSIVFPRNIIKDCIVYHTPTRFFKSQKSALILFHIEISPEFGILFRKSFSGMTIRVLCVRKCKLFKFDVNKLVVNSD